VSETVRGALVCMTMVALLGAAGCSSSSHRAGRTASTSSSAMTAPTTALVPTTRLPATPTTVAGDHGILEGFFPETATTWWAVVSSNLTLNVYVTRTTDSGARWQIVMSAHDYISASTFLNANTGWVAVSTNPGGAGPAPLYRTDNGGHSWHRIGSLPATCQLQFVNSTDGWCSSLGGAAGSMGVQLYRSTNGGTTWGLISVTNLAGTSSDDALPTGCDKAIIFTSPTAGWTSSYCNGGSAWMYTTTDAGARWFPLGSVALPNGAPGPEGAGLSPPAVSGTDLATAVNIGGQPGATAIATSTDGGRRWHSQLVRPLTRNWDVDLIDPSHWRLTNGTVLMATDNAGATWRTRTPSVPLKAPGAYGNTLTLDFLTPQLGWASPGADGGPFWWTTNDGATWQAVTVTAGPYVVDPPP
jgi:hypothetical protein